MLLDVQRITKSYDGETILQDVSFHLEEREKAAIVGINGAGKTTLLRIIVGEETADDGICVFSRDCVTGYLAQHQDYRGEGTIYRAVYEVNGTLLALEDEMRAAEQDMKHLEGEALKRRMNEYARISEEFERRNGYAYRSEVTGVLKGLGFTEDSFENEASTLSGGQKTRLSLARILLSAPSLLILDEPTNHLDMPSVAWLENYLAAYRGAVLVVSHDRYFMNRFVGKVIEIENTKAQVFRGTYDDYRIKKDALRHAQLSAYMAAQRKIAHEEAVIEKLKSFNREKSIRRAESREKMLAKIDRPDRPVDIDADMKLSLTPSKESGGDVLTLEDLSKSYDGVTLFSGLDLLIRRGERIAIVGANGTGKSTLLKIINGLVMQDTGTVTLGTNVEIGYYDQENQLLHMDKTLFEEISDEWPDMNNTRIRSVLAAFLFTGDDVFKLVSSLSGGERSRLSLARLMLSNANFLILDEPTNHLDIQSRSILEDALRSYTGTVLTVSHDRYFINRIATRILELDGARFTSYIGDYDYYVEKKAQLRQINEAESAKPESVSEEKLRWQAKKAEEAKRRKKENDIRRIEEEIDRLETRDKTIDEMLADPAIGSDPGKCASLADEKETIASKLEELMEKWEALSES